jgi:NADH:ubiquinone oxidoreductase subunit F (NADH-binding)
MTLVHRVLYPSPIASLDEYLARGGGAGLEKALTMDHDAIIAEVLASGLRGRGGAGFPTGIKWRTVRDYHAESSASTVVVNGAEGEPGTFKDRTILANDPFQVVEGALIAARAVGADQIFFGLKRSFGTQLSRLRQAIAEIREIGWATGIDLIVFEGPHEYLYGEETALLETIDGRYPFPRIAPPFRRGVREVVEHDDDVDSRSNLSAHVDMASPGGETEAPPTLVDNVETLANVPRIMGRGAAWFRTEGTEASPGTIVCTVTGSTVRAGVGEFIMGTPLREVIDEIGGGARPGHRIKAVLSGVSNALIPADRLDTGLCYEALAAIGSGLGSAGFIVFDETDDLVSVAAGASRFLAVESCGQCVPCKRDGLALADVLGRISLSDASEADLSLAKKLLSNVGERARCALAGQQQAVVGSVFDLFGAEIDAHVSRAAPGAEPYLIAELLDIEGDEPVWDERHRDKQPDWSYDEVSSGQVPADKFDEHRSPEPLPE